MPYSNDMLEGVLKKVRTIAMVGASPKWVRPSSFAMKYLQGKGYRVIPVNPGHAGKEINGETVYASLSDSPDDFDMVNIFRKSEDVGPIMEEAIELVDAKGISVVWMQLGVFDATAASLGEDYGLTVIMDRCPKIEYARLCGELGWSGINTGIISSKRPKFRL
jgi:predicted CoA-binding protein